MIGLICIALLLFGAGCFKGIMDTLQFHFDDSIYNDPTRFDPEYFNPQLSWMNKWNRPNSLHRTPKFWGSTTIFVWTTDAWHLCQFCMLTLTFSALAVALLIDFCPEWYWIVAITVALRGVYGFGFWLLYNKLLIKR